MIAGGEADHTFLFILCAQVVELVEDTARFEGAGLLEHFELEVQPNPRLFTEVSGSHDGRAMHATADDLARGEYILELYQISQRACDKSI